jgi:peptidoglycan/xylan/chitin deacetylase (PgdA/CDA1 family)
MKRVFKLLISLLVRCCDVCRAGLLRLTGRKPIPSCVVLYYHGIPAPERHRFARQMDEVIRRTQPISADSRPVLNGKSHYCAVTFDDGFVSVLENALPELADRRIPATLFVPTGSLGQSPSWIKGARSSAEMVLSASQLAELKQNELVTIGSHSITHPNFLAIDHAHAERELKQSKADLEALLGRPVILFSFPHGACNGATIEMAKGAGYRRVFTIEPEAMPPTTEEFVMGRVATGPADWPTEFRLKLLGAYRWLTWI